MQVPLQVTFQQLPHSDALEARIRERALELEQFHDHLISCRVTVRSDERHKHQGGRFNIRIELAVPNHRFAITRDHDEDAFVAVRDAFDAARRRLEDLEREVRGHVKTHADTLHGRVARLWPERGYGFIESDAGDEFYFARENVITPPFEHLHAGMTVQFIEEAAAEGLQAKRVRAREQAT